MNIREFSHNLQKVYDEMGQTFSDFQKESKLPCLTDCGLCCHNPEVEASPMEMIPMALRILDEGTLEEWHERLQEAEDKSCQIFNGQNCGSYRERPSLCRMFGVAGYFDKQHQITISICKLIKENDPDQTEAVLKSPAPNAPVMTGWSSRLSTLDPHLIQERQPINLALKSALERVALWSQYNE